ncbi:hypothetical protein QSH18_03195 [Xanthomonas sp. NCPPB 2654]|uniref:hypothetical protein n=1 Tax=unclassified Xanthomonas TaxID=2643310 RepID=UPI0021E0BD6D|nr:MULTISPECIES: hypothetical protein [unclassified Xanthomonas]MDL5364604.1 hypothetical protein [Xanthomonas sp. NCPPB 2654]UYC21921.1 hypothetical protein NUG20_06400 [Xanthomonas sp. CFBP 8443]
MQQSKGDVVSGGEVGERPEKRNAPAVPLWRMLRQTFGVDLKWLVPCWGGGMVLAHFLRIGYVPSLSLGDLGVVLSAVALFGGIALIAFLAVLALPAWVMGLLVDQHLLVVPLRPRQDDAPRRGLKSYYRRTQLALGRRRERVFGSLWLFAGAALLSAMYYAFLLLCEHWGFVRFAAYGVIAGFGLGALALALLTVVWDVDRVRRYWPVLRRPRGTLSLMLLVYLAFWPLAAFAVGYVAPPTKGSDWFYLAVVVFIVVFFHWLVYATHRVPFSKRFRVLGAAVLMVLAYSGALLGTVDVTVRKLGIGMLPGVQLQVTEQGCQIVKAAWPAAQCDRAQPASNVYVLRSVDVLTRLGSDFYVAPPGGLGDEHKPRFLIPASQVLSWSRVEAPKKRDAAAAAQPGK